MKEITRRDEGPWDSLGHLCTLRAQHPASAPQIDAKDHRDPHRSHATHVRSHNLEAPEPELKARPLTPNALFCSFFYVMLPCPAQNPPWLPCSPQDKIQTSQVVPLAPEGKATGHVGGREPRREGGDAVPAAEGTAGSLPGHGTPTQSAIHHLKPSSDALCPFPIDLIKRRLQLRSHLGNVLIVPFMCPFVAQALQSLKGRFKSMFLPLSENYYRKQ